MNQAVHKIMQTQVRSFSWLDYIKHKNEKNM